jgi:hypothetical protein
MSVSDDGHGNPTVSLDWHNSDANGNATAAVSYRIYPETAYDANGNAFGVPQVVTHTGNQQNIVISGLTPGRYYDFRVEVSDPGGVIGSAIQQDTGRYLRDDRFQFTVAASNQHFSQYDEVQVRDIVGGKLHWASNMTWWPYNRAAMSYGYEYTLADGLLNEFSVPEGKAAWQSVVDRSRGRVYITGEMPRAADSPDGRVHFRSMVGVITEGATPTLETYLIPGTDDVNELIGVCMDSSGNRLIAGERGSVSPNNPTGLLDSTWPNGGGLWVIPIDTINDPNTYQRVFEHTGKHEWSHLMIFRGRIYAQINDGSVISAPLSAVAPGMQAGDWTTEFEATSTSKVTAMIVSRDGSRMYAVTDQGNNSQYNDSTIWTNTGSGWSNPVTSKLWWITAMYELTDGRLLLISAYTTDSSHYAGVEDPVTGSYEYLWGGNLGSSLPGCAIGGANYNYLYDGNDIYYGTAYPGRVIKVSYVP